MRNMLRFIRKVEVFLASLFLAIIVVFVFIAAVARTVGHPIIWSIDLAQLLFGWIVFLGADIALKSDSHIGIDAIVKLFPKGLQRRIMLVNYCFICLFLCVIIYHGYVLCIENYPRQFNTLKLSYSYATLSVPTGSALMLLTAIGKIKDLLFNKDVNYS